MTITSVKTTHRDIWTSVRSDVEMLLHSQWLNGLDDVRNKILEYFHFLYPFFKPLQSNTSICIFTKLTHKATKWLRFTQTGTYIRSTSTFHNFCVLPWEGSSPLPYSSNKGSILYFLIPFTKFLYSEAMRSLKTHVMKATRSYFHTCSVVLSRNMNITASVSYKTDFLSRQFI